MTWEFVKTVWPAWLWIGTPTKVGLWAVNRVATWTGVAYLWKRFRSRRVFWLWMVAVNLVSFGALALLFFCLHRFSRE